MTKRRTLKDGKKNRKSLDMPKVYKALDSGRSVQSVADEWGVSPATLHRRHHAYQAELDLILMLELPPLPEDVANPFKEKAE